MSYAAGQVKESYSGTKPTAGTVSCGYNVFTLCRRTSHTVLFLHSVDPISHHRSYVPGYSQPYFVYIVWVINIILYFFILFNTSNHFLIKYSQMDSGLSYLVNKTTLGVHLLFLTCSEDKHTWKWAAFSAGFVPLFSVHPRSFLSLEGSSADFT